MPNRMYWANSLTTRLRKFFIIIGEVFLICLIIGVVLITTLRASPLMGQL